MLGAVAIYFIPFIRIILILRLLRQKAKGQRPKKFLEKITQLQEGSQKNLAPMVQEGSDDPIFHHEIHSQSYFLVS